MRRFYASGNNRPGRRFGRDDRGWLASIVGAIFAGWSAAALAGQPLAYNRDIRPILAENCFACHGPDSAARKAELRLDQRDAAIEAGVIAPGDLEASELIVRICSDDPGQVMPPPATGKRLTDRQKGLLKEWIAAGAEYQRHWSLIAPARLDVPRVKNTGWVRNGIDNFILAALEAQGLSPAPEADRRTLARRLSLDLTGLPPEPAVVEAFVDDLSPDACEQLVERLMQSKRWGEHRGRYWLDAARYADTHGIHVDNYREMWSYRDWVIGAFNDNMPFDQFTVEQLAGDLLPERTLEQQIASGFNRCNITTNEGGVIAEEYLVLYTRDRTETASQVWLGLTAGCAVCHDHKFDPLSQREFYELAAFFNNTTQQAMDGNIKDTPPIVYIPRREERPRFAAIEAVLTPLRKQLDMRKQAARPEFNAWQECAVPEFALSLIPEQGQTLHVPLNEGEGNVVALVVDGRERTTELPEGLGWKAPGRVARQALESKSNGGTLEFPDAGDFDTNQPFSYGASVRISGESPTGAFLARMDDSAGYRGWDLWYENGQIAAHLVSEWPGNALKVVTRDDVKRREWLHLFVTYDGSARRAGLKIYVNGVEQATNVQADSLTGTIRTSAPLTLAQRRKGDRLGGLIAQDVRVYDRELSAEEVSRLAGAPRAAFLLAGPPEKRDEGEGEVKELYNWWLSALDRSYRELRDAAAPHEREWKDILSRGTIGHVMNEANAKPRAYILFRGEYDKRRDPVKPDTPDILPQMPEHLPKNRLGFARWLLQPDHPLTSRVTVNRFWQEVFGTGLVRTAGDFGVSGELPSHPELLDWLAVEFRESGWDVKRLFKLLVTSAAYRQSAVTTPAKLERDPQNRWLSRGPRFRMDGEMIRDYALAASGLLAGKIGGPSVKPYQPPGVWEAVAMTVSNTRKYVQDRGESLYRRSLYTFWKRAAPPALMDLFNAPSRETCTVRRERTNTPLQALATLNDPTFVEAARRLAERALSEGGDTFDSRLAFMAERLLSRPLRAAEVQVARTTFESMAVFYRDHAREAGELIAVGDSSADRALDPSTLAAWTMLANELMNLDEVLNK